ncbi:MAG: Ig-like domain-containing protein, partial [Myxococcales bacterium]|nr:Ig-like domain-containing protein [Myxococcales bacterium]
LWSGVPPLEPHPGDLASVIEPRPGPEKPTTVGERIELAFPPEVPPETSRPEVTTGPLTVERFGPTGPLDLVDAVRVTFNQPMVPLASVESLATKTVPLVIEPAVAGKARWLGTRTVAFYPEGRLPFSTTYTMRVPADSVSMSGNKLEKEVRWTISTPTLALVSADPWNGATGRLLDQNITLTFNQPVQRTALAAALDLTAGGKDVPFTIVDPPFVETMEPWQRDRIVVLDPKDKLTPDTSYAISLPAGVYGEGPERSAAISTGFSTYPPLTLSLADCGTPCYAGGGITLVSSTPVADPKLEDKVHISPAVPNLRIEDWGGIHLGGDFTGDTTYTVTVDAGVLDAHGQSLAKPFRAVAKLGPFYPELGYKTPAPSPAVIELGAPRELTLRIAGLDRVEVEGASFPPSRLGAYLDVYAYDSSWGWPRDIGKFTWSKRFDVKPSRRKRQDLLLGLDELLGTNRMAWLTVRSNEIQERDWKWRAGLSQFVVVTDLGVAAAVDRDSGTIMVTRLSTGEPVAGVAVSIGEAMSTPVWTGTTDAEGLASATFSPLTYGHKVVVKAELGDDAAFLRLDQGDLRGQWRYWNAPEDQALGFFFTDRAPYKPGDTIHLVGVLRQQTRGPKGGTAWWRQNATATYKVVDPRGVDVASGEAKIGPFGTVAVDIPTKPDGGTGSYQFQMEVPSLFGPNQTFHHAVSVETYRTPEFTVAVARPDSKPLVFGDTLVAEIRGEYLHGAPLVGGEVAYALTRTETDFRPPGSENDAFVFGAGSSAWGGYREYGRGRHGGGHGGWGWSPPSTTLRNATGTLDATGKLVVTHTVVAKEPPPPGTPAAAVVVPTGPEPLPRAATYAIAATVTDQNRQAIGGTGSFVVHPAKIYVGIRTERSVLREGERTNLEAVAVDLEGARTTGNAITVDFVRQETTRTAVEKDGRWSFEYKTTEARIGGCALVSDAAPQPCEVSPDKAGTYVARATAKDAAGHETRSELSLYVHGKDAIVWDAGAERRVDLVADKRTYAPGDTAKVLLRSPFTDARGIVVVEREGIATEIPVVVTGGAHAVEIPITEDMVGGVTLSAMLTRGRTEIPGAPKGQDLGMPAAAAGQVDLDVVTDSKTIVVALEPHAKEIAPKGSLSLSIKTTRKDGGAALPAAVAVMVVDEGVLSLMAYETPDPVAFFHGKRQGEVWLHALQANVLPRDDVATPVVPTTPTTTTPSMMPMGGAGIRRDMPSDPTSGMPMPKPSAAAPGAAPPPMMEKARDSAPAREEERKADSSSRAAGEAGFDVTAAMAQGVSLRTVFATTAFFDAEIVTDENG